MAKSLLTLMLVSLLVGILAPLVGAIVGFAVSFIFEDAIFKLLAHFGIRDMELWEIGASLAFLAIFLSFKNIKT